MPGQSPLPRRAQRIFRCFYSTYLRPFFPDESGLKATALFNHDFWLRMVVSKAELYLGKSSYKDVTFYDLYVPPNFTQKMF